MAPWECSSNMSCLIRGSVSPASMFSSAKTSLCSMSNFNTSMFLPAMFSCSRIDFSVYSFHPLSRGPCRTIQSKKTKPVRYACGLSGLYLGRTNTRCNWKYSPCGRQMWSPSLFQKKGRCSCSPPGETVLKRKHPSRHRLKLRRGWRHHNVHQYTGLYIGRNTLRQLWSCWNSWIPWKRAKPAHGTMRAFINPTCQLWFQNRNVLRFFANKRYAVRLHVRK